MFALNFSPQMDQPAGTWKWGRAAWCRVWRCTVPGTRGGSD